MNSNTSIHDQAYHAYLMIFDANNLKERKILLEKIIKDPRASYLFLINCSPNKKEKQIVLNAISGDPLYSYKTACNCDLELDEKEILYEKNKISYSKTTEIETYLDYCLAFQEFMTNNEKELLIEKVFDDYDLSLAKKILNSKIDLPDYLKDKLESIFVISTLYGA